MHDSSTQTFPGAASAPRTGRPALCFLVGAPRSGTTWVQRLLQSHPAICGGEESHFFTFFSHALNEADRMAANEQRRIGPLAFCSRARFEDGMRQLWDTIFEDLYADHPNALVHLEKTPFHALCLPDVVRLFPEARIIYLARDSRAVAASLVHAGRSWGSYWAPSDFRGAAREWYRHAAAATRFRDAHPDHPFLTIRYEDALEDTPAVLGRMLDFLLPEGTDPQLAATLERFEAGQAARSDPGGFARIRGREGWREDMPLWAKLTTWRRTRHMMKELGYDITPFR